MSSNRDDDHGRGPRRLCEPHDGSRTPSFLPFKRNFKTGLDAIFLHEDDYSLWSAVFGTDQGGDDPNAPALPAQGQNGYLQAVRKRAKRQKKAFEMVFNHIDNERLKDMLDDLPDNGDKGRAAWQLILAECDLGTTDLDIRDIRAEFESINILVSVGYTLETITNFARVLNSHNAKLPNNHKYSDDAMTVKLLSSIDYPESLALEALTELDKTAGNRRFERVVNGNAVRDYTAAVRYFDVAWRGLFKQGIIKSRIAGKRGDGVAAR